MLKKLLFLSMSVLTLAGCGSRSLDGSPVYCQCAVPLLGRGGCGGYGIPFDSWACVPPGESAVPICNQACISVAGIGSGSFLSCDGYPGTDVPVIRDAPEFAGRCLPSSGTASPLLATSGYESSPWDYVAARSTIRVTNPRDSRAVPLNSGRISLYMPAGPTAAGPMRFDMLSLVGQTGGSGAFTFDGHDVRDFRLLNSGRFTGTAGPGYAPAHPGQFNSYRISSGYPLEFAVKIDGTEVSDVISDTTARSGWMYTDSTGSYLVYEGSFTLDSKNATVLNLHLEFRYGGGIIPVPPPPALDIPRQDNANGTVELTVDLGNTPPGSSITYVWVAGEDLSSKATVLGNGPNLKVDPKKIGDWVSVLVHLKDAQVWRQAKVCLKPKGVGC